MEVEEAVLAASAAASAAPVPGGSGMLEDEVRPRGTGDSTGMDTSEAVPATGPKQHELPPTNPHKKRKVALFMAYVGHGYNGMQRNPGVKTIEEDLFKAIHAAGGISDSNADEQGFIKIHWMRAARTDKGVSAVGQVVSLKVVPSEGLVERINQHLPPQIRVFGFARATNGFDARKHCDKRRYEYILPAWAFDPEACQPRQYWAMQQHVQQSQRQPPRPTEVAPVEIRDQLRREGAGDAREGAGQPPAATDTAALPAGAAAAVADGGGTVGSALTDVSVVVGAVALAEPGQSEAANLQAAAAAAALAVSSRLQPGGQQGPAAEAAEVLSAAAAAAAQAPEAAAAAAIVATAVAGCGAALAAAAPDAEALPAKGAGGEHTPTTAPPAADAGKSPAAQPDLQARGAAVGTGCTSIVDAAVPAQPGPEAPAPYVFDQACVGRLSSILGQYEGTHNFHNFTVRVAPNAPQAKRYMLSFKCAGLLDIDGQPWVKMVVVGQSFMLHQIRKMVGLAVAVFRGTAPPDAIKLALRTHKDLNVPMAPELGLFLDECFYESYSKQWGHQHGELGLAPYAQEVQAFKDSWLYPHIARRDAEEGVNASWLRQLNNSNYEFSRWADAVAGRLPAGVVGGLRGVGKPPPKGAGTAAFIGGLESYGSHKRRLSGEVGNSSGRSGGGGSGQGRKPPPEGDKRQRTEDSQQQDDGESWNLQASLDAELSD
ncbi:hypothetical protein N2152v2_009430 [Parachlorella kessleri]